MGEDIAKTDVIRGGAAGRPVLAVADAPGVAVVALGDVAPGDAAVDHIDIVPGDAAVLAIGPAVDHSDAHNSIEGPAVDHSGDVAMGAAAVRAIGPAVDHSDGIDAPAEMYSGDLAMIAPDFDGMLPPHLLPGGVVFKP